MGHPCKGFEMEDAAAAFEHFKGNLELVEDYGDECGGRWLHAWDDGGRSLLKCRACGGYALLQRSEYHGPDSDSYYRDYFPVSGPEEAAELNERLDGTSIEDEFEGRYLIQDGGKPPSWRN